MIALLLSAALAADPRRACLDGDQAACDRLLVEITAQVAADLRAGRPPIGREALAVVARGGDALRAAREDHRHGHVDSARVQCALRGQTDGVCGPLRWSQRFCESDSSLCEPTRPPVPDGLRSTPAREDANGVRYRLLTPKWDRSVVAGPVVLFRSDAPPRWLTQPWCWAELSDHAVPRVIGAVGAACDEGVMVSVDGEELAREPLPVGATRMLADDHATWVLGPGSQLGRRVDGQTIAARDLEPNQRVTGLLTGEPVIAGQRESTVGERTYPGACQPLRRGRLLCVDEGLAREVDGATSSLLGRDVPTVDLHWPETLPDGGETTVWVLTEPGAPAVLSRGGPNVLQKPWYRDVVVATADAAANGLAILGPVPASAGLVVQAMPTPGPGTWILRPSRPLTTAVVRVVDANGRPVHHADVRGATRAVTSADGRASVACWGTVRAFAGDHQGRGKCADGQQVVLDTPRPICRLGADRFPCDALSEHGFEGTFASSTVGTETVLTPMVSPDPVLSPPISIWPEMLGGMSEGTRVWFPIGPLTARQGTSVRSVEALCATGEVTATDAHLNFRPCQPLQRRVVVDANGTPVLATLRSEEPESGSAFYARSALDGAVWLSPRRTWTAHDRVLADDGMHLLLDVAPSSEPHRDKDELVDMSRILTGAWRTPDGRRRLVFWPDGRIEQSSARGKVLRTWTGGASIEVDRSIGVVVAVEVDTLMVWMRDDAFVLER